MYETMTDKLEELMQTNEIDQIDIRTKCRTKDGMIYTLNIDECRKQDAPEEVGFPEYVNSTALESVLDFTNLIEGTGLIFSAIDLVSIRKDEISRVWAELGNIYVDDAPQEN